MSKKSFLCTFCGSLSPATTARDHGQAMVSFHFDRHNGDNGLVCRGSGTEVTTHSIELVSQSHSGGDTATTRRVCAHNRR